MYFPRAFAHFWQDAMTIPNSAKEWMGINVLKMKKIKSLNKILNIAL